MEEGVGVVARVVDAGDDAGVGEFFDETIAVVGEDPEEVIAVVTVGFEARQFDAGNIAEEFEIVLGEFIAVGVVGVEVFEMFDADGRGDVVHVVAVPEFGDFVFPGAGLASELRDAGEGVLVEAHVAEIFGTDELGFGEAGEHAAVAGGEIFDGIEGESAEVSIMADALIAERCAAGVGTIFDHGKIVFVGEGVDGFEITAVTGEMDEHDGTCFGGDFLRDVLGGEVSGGRIDIGEHGHKSFVEQHLIGAHERGGRGNNFVVGAQLKKFNGHVER